MKNLLKKEIRLASSPITWVFILFGALTMIPGYIILLGAFFVCLGLFHSYQNARENGDVMYTMLLPVKKSDYVRAKYTFTVMIQMLALALMFVLTIVRMTVLGSSITYITNEMMNAVGLDIGAMVIPRSYYDTKARNSYAEENSDEKKYSFF